MDNTNEMQQIEESVKHAKLRVEEGVAIERLRKNKDFQRIVIDGFFNKEAVRLVHALSNPEMQTPEKQESLYRQMAVISGFQSYLNTLMVQARMAVKEINDGESILEEMRKDI